MTRIVTTTYRYKRPPRKQHAVPLTSPAVVTARQPNAAPAAVTAPPPANDDRKPAEGNKPAIVTARRPGKRFSDVPDMTPEEHRRRGDAADALFREMKRRSGEKLR